VDARDKRVHDEEHGVIQSEDTVYVIQSEDTV